MKTRLIGVAVLAAAAASACNPPPSDPPPPQADEAKGREETKNIRNTKAIGMPGSEIAHSLDKALDANDLHQKQLKDADEETKAGTQPEPEQ